jgi:hypothetical protein
MPVPFVERLCRPQLSRSRREGENDDRSDHLRAFCIENGYALLHDERDFDLLARYLGPAVV